MKPASHDGFALVGVLWNVMILSLALASITTMMRGQSRECQFALEKAGSRALADAAINLAILSLLSPDATQWPRRDGTPFHIQFQGRPIEVTVQDESGKIDINAAPAETLTKLFLYAGLRADAAQAEADRVQDWREPGELRRLDGAKTRDYQEAGVRYRPRNAAFESVGEVGLVLGMSAEITARVMPLITIYSEQPGVDEPTAPRPVLQALYGPDAVAIDQIMAERSRAADADVSGGFASLAGHAFRITARVRFNDDTTTRMRVVRLSADLHNPVWTYEAE